MLPADGTRAFRQCANGLSLTPLCAFPCSAGTQWLVAPADFAAFLSSGLKRAQSALCNAPPRPSSTPARPSSAVAVVHKVVSAQRQCPRTFARSLQEAGPQHGCQSQAIRGGHASGRWRGAASGRRRIQRDAAQDPARPRSRSSQKPHERRDYTLSRPQTHHHLAEYHPSPQHVHTPAVHLATLCSAPSDIPAHLAVLFWRDKVVFVGVSVLECTLPLPVPVPVPVPVLTGR